MAAENVPSPAGIGGFFYPFRGVRFLFSHPRLFGYVAVPLGINTLLYALFFWFVGSRFGGWVHRLLPQGDAWYWTLLSYLLWVVFGAVVLLMVIYTFTLVGILILAPFNALLSEKVEWVYTGRRLDEPFSLRALLADTKRSLLAEVGRLALWAAGFLVLLGLSIAFPPLGTLLTVYSLFFLGWEYFDYSMERRRYSFSLKRQAASRNAVGFLSFGAGAALLLLIPLLNLVAIPVCVAGATLLFCDLARAGRLPQGPDSPVAPPPKA